MTRRKPDCGDQMNKIECADYVALRSRRLSCSKKCYEMTELEEIVNELIINEQDKMR